MMKERKYTVYMDRNLKYVEKRTVCYSAWCCPIGPLDALTSAGSWVL